MITGRCQPIKKPMRDSRLLWRRPLRDNLLQRRQHLLGRHAPLFYDEPLEIVRGEDVWLFDSNGRKYLDVYNNVLQCGHCHPHILSALTRQAGELNTHTRYLHPGIVDYVERLTALFDAPLDMAMLTCSGSEANELALRMARFTTGQQGMIVTDCTYHGNTEAVAELGTAIMPEAQQVERVAAIPAPDSYRLPEGTTPDTLTGYYLQKVDEAIATLQARGVGVAGLMVCPIFANEGLLEPPPGFMEQAVAAVRKAGGLYIADEVQGGFGRTGDCWWSHQAYGVTPDIVTLGKPMGNGHPMAGVIAPRALVEPFQEWGMYFNTFAGNPVSCAVGSAVLDVIENEGLMANAVAVGAYIREGLETLQQRFPEIGDVRQKGLFFAVELLASADRQEPNATLTHSIVNQMCRRGVLISRIGAHNNILKMRPPLPLQQEHADLLLSQLERCFSECTRA